VNITVTSAADTAGSADNVTFRYALEHALDGDAITLPPGATITLTSPLPAIDKSITINGNGATLTSNITPSDTSQLLNINATGKTVKISRLHFTGGQVVSTSSSYGGAIYHYAGTLVLESCIFSANQVSGSSYGSGGAIYVRDTATVLGCTFYNNTAGAQGGAIRGGDLITLADNLFFGNTAPKGNVIGGSNFSTKSNGYNVSNKASGISGTDTTNSGYVGNTTTASGTDLFDGTDISFATTGDPTTAPSSATKDSKTLTTLPADFPTTYFDGSERTLPATAGAVAAQ
jgi:predicted outer membrane repeat protein